MELSHEDGASAFVQERANNRGVTAFDRALLLRSFGITLLLAVIAAGVMIGTDEVGSTPAMRLARLVAIVPALSALAEVIVLSQARSRGEMLALSALGASPLRVSLGAMLAGWLAGAISVAFLLSPLSDPAPLFPTITRPESWISIGAALSDPSSGARVTSDGEITLVALAASAAVARAPGRIAAVFAVLPLAVVTPAWAVAPIGAVARLAGALITLAITIVSFHAVAAARLPPAALAVVPLPLVVQSLWVLRKERPR